ncbi:putative E3 ubiquitin ligase complex SCF subunit sconB [Leucoagaricus sp. SymC.cos]|nr:putative E3 ubiquitin ligase complex SCF subunit sconB [Leucoagaricus sp. SymC.cos]
MSASSDSYVCDTLPAPRLALPDDQGMRTDHVPNGPPPDERSRPPSPAIQQPPRKLCVRHQRMADEGTNLKLQHSLDALPLEEREKVNAIWQAFSSSSHPRRALILQGLLTMCCFSQLSLLTELLTHLIRIDPFAVLPREVSLKILMYLDATSLCRAAQVSRRWRILADDDILWRGICEQHIGQKCTKCGWGLPVLEKKRDASTTSNNNASSLIAPFSSLLSTDSDTPVSRSVTRPWKDVYSERMTIERNWRRGRCTVKTLKGHTDGVMCLQFSETLQHPAFPVLITGSYDRTVRVWNMETGVQLHCLKGHTRAVRALQFDEVKLITGSMDNTLKVWDWRGGKCIRVEPSNRWGFYVEGPFGLGQFGTALGLELNDEWDNPCPGKIDPGKMLFSASDDGTIRLWDLTQRTCLRQLTGHVGQVQSMRLLIDEECDGSASDDSTSSASTPSSASNSMFFDPTATPQDSEMDGNVVKRKKPMLVSGSLDNTIKMWDIETGKTVRTFFGHIEGVWAVASDKLRLVSGSHDRTIKVSLS